MQKFIKQIIFIILLCIGYSQTKTYRSVDEIKSEWGDYTSYQKEEMFSFCDFLFKEGHYERCLLSAFQILFKFPNDKYTVNLEYYIARSYEELKNYKLAKKYYVKVLSSEPLDPIIQKAATYRLLHINLALREYEQILENTEQNEDPYVMTFRGYAHIQKMDWEQARTSFIAAQSLFGHPHYNDMMVPIYKSIENVNDIPMHNKYIVFLSSLFPGGGQFLLGNKNKGQGVLSSVGLMFLIASWSSVDNLMGNNRILDIESISIPVNNNFTDGNSILLEKGQRLPEKMEITSSSVKYLIPPLLIGSSIFIGSSIQSFKDTKIKNDLLAQFYVDNILSNIPPSKFLDFPEPPLLIKHR